MVLADSNIMIDYFRSRNSELAQKIDSMDIALCGPIRSEILHGARTEAEIDNYLEAFQTFDNLLTDDYDWDGIGFILQTLRSNGISVPFADAVISYTAIKYDVPLWTRDTHFTIIQAYYPELKLYED
ncbi:PIN domain-containing protein [Treponema sp.]|uniref:PIN domain-containing protein n=1 Tax=Treponema sp. TaxID=166 RepID=UPI00298D6BE6|nr:PIN domain-containing protein [Treponema sp.]MCR5613966.1 PIN domain-containing protein [Treponema sp.]